MRNFKEQIFFGSEYYLEKCYKLHKRLEEAFNILGELYSDSEEIANEMKEQREENKRELNDIILDLRVALGDKIEEKSKSSFSLFEQKFMRFLSENIYDLDHILYKKEMVHFNKFDGLIELIQSMKSKVKL